MGDTYDHSLAGRGPASQQTGPLMVEPDSTEPIWKPRAACRGVAAGPVELGDVGGARVGSSSGRPSSHPSRRQSDAGVDAAGVGADRGVDQVAA